jgi:hypothetical protein
MSPSFKMDLEDCSLFLQDRILRRAIYGTKIMATNLDGESSGGVGRLGPVENQSISPDAVGKQLIIAGSVTVLTQ